MRPDADERCLERVSRRHDYHDQIGSTPGCASAPAQSLRTSPRKDSVTAVFHLSLHDRLMCNVSVHDHSHENNYHLDILRLLIRNFWISPTASSIISFGSAELVLQNETSSASPRLVRRTLLCAASNHLLAIPRLLTSGLHFQQQLCRSSRGK